MIETLDNRRIEERYSLLVIAALHSQYGNETVKIRNISASGACIEGASLPVSGTQVELRRGKLSAFGTIAWRHAGKAGVRLTRPTDVSLWRPAPGTQRQVDQTLEVLREDPTVEEIPGVPEHAPPVSVADMKSTADLLDDLADTLANDAGVLFNYATKLQSLDLASQLLRKMADHSEPARLARRG